MSFKPPSYRHQLFTIQLPNQFAQNRTILYLCTQSALSQILQPLHNLRYAVGNELLKDFHPSTRPIPPLLSGTPSNSHSVSLFLHFVQDRKSKFYRNTLWRGICIMQQGRNTMQKTKLSIQHCTKQLISAEDIHVFVCNGISCLAVLCITGHH